MRFNFLISIISFSLLAGCSTSYINTIHSPRAENGKSIRFSYAHGGATDESAPDMIEISFPNDSSSFLLITAKMISSRRRWMGVFPIPFRFIPVHKTFNNYQEKDSLEITLAFISPERTVYVYPDSLTIIYEGAELIPSKYKAVKFDYYDFENGSIHRAPFNDIEPFSVTFTEEDAELIEERFYYEPINYHLKNKYGFQFKYPVSGNKTENFDLILNGVFDEKLKVELPIINFEKNTQKAIRIFPY